MPQKRPERTQRLPSISVKFLTPCDLDLDMGLGEVAKKVSYVREGIGFAINSWVFDSPLEGSPLIPPIIGQSPQIREVLSLVERVARTDSTVLITGESGTGKELIARAIHFKSPRASKPLVVINCGAIPHELLESELFGYVRGAFTGAVRDKKGRLEVAHGGTVFLDEVSEMAPALQVKLLRVLQEKEFEPVGSVKTVKVDIRIIAATNKDLEKLVEKGRFREDLYWRLNVVPIHLPPLRERKEDLLPLLEHFLRLYNDKYQGAVEAFSPDALELLYRYDWPGNVRELENLVQRLVILKGEGVIGPEDLPEKIRRNHRGKTSLEVLGEGSLHETLNSIERELILEALRKANGVKKKAAELLGIKRTTLLHKLKKNGLQDSKDI